MFLKRIALFALVNILIVVTISTVLKILGVEPYLTQAGLNYQSLAIFCLLWGMGGSFISLMLSKFMAKRFMGVQMVTATGPYQRLVSLVHQLSRKAGLTEMPEVGLYESPEINAFATGPSKNNSLVAVSSGLLQRMDDEEVEGVIAHEVSHIANGDMVTMALIQGVVNAFVMFFARIVAFAIDQALRSDDEDGKGLGFFAHYMVVMVCEMLFGILGMIVVSFFSRWREYRADAGSARIASKSKMVKALKALQRNYQAIDDGQDKSGFKALKISSHKSWFALFSTHPSLEDRIAALDRL